MEAENVDASIAATAPTDSPDLEGHFRPTGTIAVLVMFVATLILLWLSVYLILIARGVTT